MKQEVGSVEFGFVELVHFVTNRHTFIEQESVINLIVNQQVGPAGR